MVKTSLLRNSFNHVIEKHQFEVFLILQIKLQKIVLMENIGNDYNLNMHSVTILLLIVCLASAVQIESVDSYDLESVNTYRQMVAHQNINIVKKHNSDPSRTFNMKVYPQIIGLTLPEFSARFLNKDGFKMPDQSGVKVEAPQIKLAPKDFKHGQLVGGTAVDLTNYVRTPVYNQGACGNCWAYSSTDDANINSLLWGLGRPTLSMQHLTDCDSYNSSLPYPNKGCQGGDLQYAMYYMTYNGLYTLSAYPLNTYTLNQGSNQPCKTINAPKYKISGWYLIYNATVQDCNIRATYIGYGYAISTAVFAGNLPFIYYSSGILNACSPPPYAGYLDHGVIMVGYSTSTSPSYIKIKNSWGSSWGESGYVRIAYGACNMCTYSVIGV